jgi:DNA-binding GntR family transcriptional regulator
LRPVPDAGTHALTSAERSTRTLRDAILTLRLIPGTRLVERDLAGQLGVSRTGVRAALQSLAAERLVVRGRRGVFAVAAVSAEEARQIYEVRAALEPAMARLFVQRASPVQVAALGAAVDCAAAAARAQDSAAYVEAFRSFYAVLLEGSGNEVARQFLDTLDARIAWLRYITTQRAAPARRLRTVAKLRDIYDAVQRHAPELAARRSAAFVARSARFALEVLAPGKAALKAEARLATTPPNARGGS